MKPGNKVVFTSDVATIAGFMLAILLAVGAATWNLRGFITSEIGDAMAAMNGRLESATADIRQDIRTGRESSDRQTAEIRRFIFELLRTASQGLRSGKLWSCT